MVFWGVATGAVAAVMLVAGGEDALAGLQSITIIAGLPFMIIMVMMAVALTKDLNNDPMIVRSRYAKAAVEQAVVEGVSAHGDEFHLAVESAAAGNGVGNKVDTSQIPVMSDEVMDAEATRRS